MKSVNIAILAVTLLSLAAVVITKDSTLLVGVVGGLLVFIERPKER